MTCVRVRVSILLCICLASLLGWLGWQRPAMNLPSPGSNKDDVQYFAPGPDFPLADEEVPLERMP
jgi:hypothetical protein